MLLNAVFTSFLEDSVSTSITSIQFLYCLLVSLLIGLFLAGFYTYKTQYTKSFVVTLAIIPAVVCEVIMMVNGNIGAGVAVAGAFSLVRFRSVPGTAKEIGAIFLAMGAGLATGMGYMVFAILFSLIVGGISLAYTISPFGNQKRTERLLYITIPESLNYSEVFDDIFITYLKHSEMINIKTTHMGTLFKLTYRIELKDEKQEKELIDSLRCRNGNLEIQSTREIVASNEL